MIPKDIRRRYKTCKRCGEKFRLDYYDSKLMSDLAKSRRTLCNDCSNSYCSRSYSKNTFKIQYDEEYKSNKNKLFMIYQGKCAYCNFFSTVIHHIIPIEEGGQNHIFNLVPLCNRCHSKVTGLTKKIIRKGLKYSEWDESAKFEDYEKLLSMLP